MIRPHAKYRRKPSIFWQRFGHLVRPQLPGSAQNNHTFSFFPNGLSLVRDADTLHVVGSCHDLTTCKVSPETNGWMPTFWPFGALTGTCERPKWSNAVFFFPNGFSPVCNADTLYVVGSYHNPTTCKVSEQNILFWSSRAALDAMVALVGLHVIRSGFVREMFFLIS
jgi:hypothetical protein